MQLFRFVQAAEFAEIVHHDEYRLIVGIETKYFTRDRKQMFMMIASYSGFFGQSFPTSGDFDNPLPNPIYISGKGEAIVLDAQHFPHSPVKVQNV